MGKELRPDRKQQVAAKLFDLVDLAVVDEQPVAVAERVAVRSCAGLGRGSHVGQKRWSHRLGRQLVQVEIVPGRPNAAKQARLFGPYQPTPNPSPLVAVSLDCELRLWSISECSALNRMSSSQIDGP